MGARMNDFNHELVQLEILECLIGVVDFILTFAPCPIVRRADVVITTI